MADADVRTAEPSDAAEIARIQLATWRTAYSELLPAEVLDGLDAAETERQWQETVSHGPASVLVATEGGWTVGFCAAGPAPEQETAAADGTSPSDADAVILVSTLLVEPRWGRRGHGGRLLGVMAQRLAANGARRGIVWTPEADEASRAFFHSVGWTPDGTVRTLDAGGRPIRELRLSGSLDLRFEQE
ncbi:acetyltransferase (GNAT) family protein [Halopolyspora algeriensis]|uniref:Acetyltransferase (GNAT) family protein n=1 Tax=Halopolyspora algeriensis TaxID=1500506 RepID=A0A368VGG6_9ACTN|nr:GNAT family N-acetyltransferase [Halopolyspora algeriensis]RCW39743.1 acetyltransferase (GNAT) family protein [Halopolyspora algeriensis]TQM56398.1 acetyltransferase (GNAT) family protein [Halopolyspora algeriensis]